MAFALKSFNTIAAQLVIYVSNFSSALTDFNEGSKIRTILEAFAEELEVFYLEMFRGIQEGIDNGVYDSFDFAALPSVDAYGNVVVSLTQTGTTNPMSPTTNINIPAGFRFQIPSVVQTTSGSAVSGTIYTVNTTTVWQAGNTTVTVPVTCQTTGTAGNTSGNTITGFIDTLPTTYGGTYSVTNPVAFNNGQDQETNTQRQQRFSNYIQSLGRGNIEALEFAAKQAVVYDTSGNIQERVVKVIGVEPFTIDGSKPTAYVDLYIYNGTGSTSAALVSSAQNIINGYYDANGNRVPGYKSAGIIVTVLPVVENVINFNINVIMNSGYSLTSTVQNSITSSVSQYVNSLGSGQTLLYNSIIALVKSDPSVYDCFVVTPSQDVVSPGYDTINVMGNVTINVVTNIGITGETHS